MKKIFLGVVFMLLLFASKAQNLSVNYTKELVSDSKSFMTDKNFAPYEVSGFSVAYSQSLKKLPLVINVAAARKPRWPPPRLIPYPNPPVIGRYAIENKIEADSAGFSSDKASSIDLLAGVGYILPHKENSKFIVTINADFGVALNNNTALNYYRQGKLTGSAEQVKTQLIINPNIQAKYFFSKNIGLNLIAGYNNRGGVNVGGGVVMKKRAKKAGVKFSTPDSL